MAWKEFDHAAFFGSLSPALFREERRSAYRISGPLTDVVRATLAIGAEQAPVTLMNIATVGAAVLLTPAACRTLRAGLTADRGPLPAWLTATTAEGTRLVRARVERVGMTATPQGLVFRMRFLDTGCPSAELDRRLERHLSLRDSVRISAAADAPVPVRLSRGPRGAPMFGCLRDISHGGVSVVVRTDADVRVEAGLTTGVCLAFPEQEHPAQLLATVRHVQAAPCSTETAAALVLGLRFADRGSARCAHRDLVSRFIVERQLEMRRKKLKELAAPAAAPAAAPRNPRRDPARR